MMNVKDFFATKRTYRKFKQDPVSDEIIDDILASARYSASGANRQGLKYVVVKTPENVRKLNELVHYAGYLPVVGTPGPAEIPALFIAVVQDASIQPVSDTDAGIAIGNMTTAAWIHGVGNCIMGAIERPAIKTMLGIKDEDVLHTVIAFGYPDKKSYVVDFKGDIKYYMDENGDTCVPKRSREEIVRFFD